MVASTTKPRGDYHGSWITTTHLSKRNCTLFPFSPTYYHGPTTRPLTPHRRNPTNSTWLPVVIAMSKTELSIFQGTNYTLLPRTARQRKDTLNYNGCNQLCQSPTSYPGHSSSNAPVVCMDHARCRYLSGVGRSWIWYALTAWPLKSTHIPPWPLATSESMLQSSSPKNAMTER